MQYEVAVYRDGNVISLINEEHLMRFMFVQEMALAMDKAGLEFIYCCPFMDLSGELNTETWNATFLGRRRH